MHFEGEVLHTTRHETDVFLISCEIYIAGLRGASLGVLVAPMEVKDWMKSYLTVIGHGGSWPPTCSHQAY